MRLDETANSVMKQGHRLMASGRREAVAAPRDQLCECHKVGHSLNEFGVLSRFSGVKEPPCAVPLYLTASLTTGLPVDNYGLSSRLPRFQRDGL